MRDYYYRIFGRYGFFRHTIPVWIRVACAYPKVGFDYRDCWNLDVAMAKWLAPRLLLMAKQTASYPGVAPYDGEDGHDAWTADLMKAGLALDLYSRVWDETDWDVERDIREAAQEKMAWVAKWFPHLWD